MDSMDSSVYKLVKSDLSPDRLIKYNPCEEDFGQFCHWYYLNNINYLPPQKRLARIRNPVWLKWLERKGIIKKEEPQFDPRQIKIEYRDNVAYIVYGDRDKIDGRFLLHINKHGVHKVDNVDKRVPIEKDDCGRIVEVI